MTGVRRARRDSNEQIPRRPARSATARPRRRAATSLVAGMLLIVAAALLWLVGRPTPAGETVSSVGTSGALELTVPAPTAPATSPSAAAAPAPPESAATTPPDTSAVLAPPAAPSSPPDRLVIPTLGVDAPVSPVGVADDGDVEVPDDVDTVGWYRFGPTPGAAGSSVLVGHVDDHRQGIGVLARIGDLGPGDPVEIVGDGGDVRRFTVVAREQWGKSDAPLDRLFDRGGSSRLVLITCGGAFDAGRLEYTDTIAVTATPNG